MDLPVRELERRWAALRAAMGELGIDVLLAQANNDFMGGYVRYLTGIPATNGYPLTVIFPRDDQMVLVAQGPLGGDSDCAPLGRALPAGTKRILTTASWASTSFTRHYEAQLAAQALAKYSRATVGLVGSALPHSFVDYLTRDVLAQARVVDATDPVDALMARKSPAEIELIRCAAAIQDQAMGAAIEAAAPGMREIDVVAAAEVAARRMGSEQGIFLAASGPVGTAPVMHGRFGQQRVLQAGDQLHLLLELNGPGGFYTELGRTIVLGKASPEMHDEFQFVLRARQFTLELLRPGVAAGEIWRRYNAFMRESGRPEERRVHCHGMGYDMVERPVVRHDETMTIEPDMSMSLHPAYATQRTHNWLCDNFLIGRSGMPERLHRFPEAIHEKEV